MANGFVIVIVLHNAWCDVTSEGNDPVEFCNPTLPPCSGHGRAKLRLQQLPQHHPSPAPGDVQQDPQCGAATTGPFSLPSVDLNVLKQTRILSLTSAHITLTLRMPAQISLNWNRCLMRVKIEISRRRAGLESYALYVV